MVGIEYLELIKLVGGAIAVSFVGVAGFFGGKKNSSGEVKTDAAVEVVAASFMDSRTLADLSRNVSELIRGIERLREERHDDSRLLRLAIEEASTRLARNTEALEAGSVTPRELASLIGRLTQSK